MQLTIASFFAGILTILAPCVIALLPIILSGTIGEKNPWRPLVIALSLGISVAIFTLLLKASTTLIDIPQSFWQNISGGLILAFGIIMIFPEIWEKLAFKLKLYKSENLLAKSANKKGLMGAVFLGAALGPVFSSCSPTYALILGIVLPQNFGMGVINILIYSFGLMLPLIAIGYGGQKISAKFKAGANPKGWLKRSLGLLLVVVGILIITGWDKKLQTYILDKGYVGPINIEQSLLEKVDS